MVDGLGRGKLIDNVIRKIGADNPAPFLFIQTGILYGFRWKICVENLSYNIPSLIWKIYMEYSYIIRKILQLVIAVYYTEDITYSIYRIIYGIYLYTYTLV